MQERWDAKDREIIRCLQQDGRRTTNDVADKIHLSASATSRRISRLEASGVIAGYTAVIDAEKLGYNLRVMVEISLKSQTDEALDEFEASLKNITEIQSCYLMSGNADYIMQIVAKDLKDFERLHRSVLSTLPHVDRMHTAFALRQVVSHQEY